MNFIAKLRKDMTYGELLGKAAKTDQVEMIALSASDQVIVMEDLDAENYGVMAVGQPELAGILMTVPKDCLLIARGAKYPYKRPKPVILLEALLMGLPIRYGRRMIQIRETDQGPAIVTQVGKVIFGPGPEKIENAWVGMDIDLTDFIISALKVSDEEAYNQLANIALNIINHSGFRWDQE